MEVYVIRHTRVASGNSICYGQTEVELADSFNEELDKLKQNLPKQVDAIFSSPLKRCEKLANDLNLGEVTLEDQLKEVNFGNWENQEWNNINQSELTAWMEDFVNVKPPKGENLYELSQRVNSFLDELAKQEFKRVLLVTHAGVIRCLWSYILEIPLNNIFKIPVGHGEIFVCKLSKDKQLNNIKQFT